MYFSHKKVCDTTHSQSVYSTNQDEISRKKAYVQLVLNQSTVLIKFDHKQQSKTKGKQKLISLPIT